MSSAIDYLIARNAPDVRGTAATRLPFSQHGKTAPHSAVAELGDACQLLVKTMLPIVICFSLVSCGPAAQKQIRSEITGTQQERIARATAILNKYIQLPGPLLDAHMAEDVQNNSYGWVPGPSDSSLSGVVLIAATDLTRWREALSPALTSDQSPVFTSACHLPSPSWWPAAAAFEGCEFYAPAKLTGRHGGFVAVSPPAAAIYFSTF